MIPLYKPVIQSAVDMMLFLLKTVSNYLSRGKASDNSDIHIWLILLWQTDSKVTPMTSASWCTYLPLCNPFPPVWAGPVSASSQKEEAAVMEWHSCIGVLCKPPSYWQTHSCCPPGSEQLCALCDLPLQGAMLPEEQRVTLAHSQWNTKAVNLTATGNTFCQQQGQTRTWALPQSGL